MSQHVSISIDHGIGLIVLNRPAALNAVSLAMVRAIVAALTAWREDDQVRAVLVRSGNDKAFCAGGDIRALHDAIQVRHDASEVEAFFTEEYRSNHLIHFYPKPYIVLMDGIVMGGGMGLAQAWQHDAVRIVTERTKMAMPEVKIGLFPDIGASYFLSRAPGCIGRYLALTGTTIGAADALYAGLADVFIPSISVAPLLDALYHHHGQAIADVIQAFVNSLAVSPPVGSLAKQACAIDRHFKHASVPAIIDSLAADASTFAQQTLTMLRQRSPLMLCVTLRQLQVASTLTYADCLRMERTMVQHCFQHGEVLEGIRALVIDKDQQAQWRHQDVGDVSMAEVERFFTPIWAVHPLQNLR